MIVAPCSLAAAMTSSDVVSAARPPMNQVPVACVGPRFSGRALNCPASSAGLTGSKVGSGGVRGTGVVILLTGLSTSSLSPVTDVDVDGRKDVLANS